MLISAGISAATSIAGGLFSSASARRARRRARREVAEQRQKNQNWYDRRYNEDATQRADAQRLLTMTEESIKRRNKSAEGAAAVMGSTEEGVAAQKAANNEAIANATSQIAADGAARQDRIEAQYMAREEELDNKLAEINGSKNNSAALGAAVQGLGSVAGSLIGG